METILAALISGAFSVTVALIANNKSNQKIMAEMKAEYSKEQAVTNCKIEELTREVREHNNFARRMPALEQKVEGIDEKINILPKQ